MSLPDDELNRLLGMVVDVENIFMSMHREEDIDTKGVYYYLFKVGNQKKMCKLIESSVGVMKENIPS